jgi:iron(III) transport system ATP-binding protein
MLKLENIQIALGEKQIIHDVSLSLASGDIGCLLGPSGCGKTTLLRAIAGFIPLVAGIIRIKGETVSSSQQHIDVTQRKVGVVFQDFALFPHLTVGQNIVFGLHQQTTQQQQARLTELLDLTQLTEYADQYPHQLSGGQQQRVAIARALAPRPEILLLDEPFSALDPSLRESLALDIKTLLKYEGVTALLITHDQTEAFTIADKIAVMNDGHIEQYASAYDLYHEPQTYFVANFVGEGRFIQGRVVVAPNTHGVIQTALGEFAVHEEPALAEYEKQALLLVRPDDFVVEPTSPYQVTVIGRAFRGAHILYTFRHADSGQDVLCLLPSHHDYQVGTTVGIRLELEHVIYF